MALASSQNTILSAVTHKLISKQRWNIKNPLAPDTQSNGSSETAGTSASRTDVSVIDEERFWNEKRNQARLDLAGTNKVLLLAAAQSSLLTLLSWAAAAKTPVTVCAANEYSYRLVDWLYTLVYASNTMNTHFAQTPKHVIWKQAIKYEHLVCRISCRILSNNKILRVHTIQVALQVMQTKHKQIIHV